MTNFYLPLSQRTPDTQYRDQLAQILRFGAYTKHPFQPVGRRVLIDLPPMVFDLKNGFPIITDRKMPFAKTLPPISEMLAFIHGAHTGEEMEIWGVKWWRTWVTPEKCNIFGLPSGEMGLGSYGAGFNALEFIWEDVSNHPDGGRYVPKVFRQFEHLIKQIHEMPFLSTHKISCWIPHYCLQHSDHQRKVVVAPCHGDVQVTILGNRLHLNMTQRSGDYPVGVPADIVMYGALTIMLAHITGYVPGKLVHRVIDAHLYENQIPHIEKMIWETKEAKESDKRTELFNFPTLDLTNEGREVRDIYDFRAEHFQLRDYVSHPAIPEIPVTE